MMGSMKDIAVPENTVMISVSGVPKCQNDVIQCTHTLSKSSSNGGRYQRIEMYVRKQRMKRQWNLRTQNEFKICCDGRLSNKQNNQEHITREMLSCSANVYHGDG